MNLCGKSCDSSCIKSTAAFLRRPASSKRRWAIVACLIAAFFVNHQPSIAQEVPGSSATSRLPPRRSPPPVQPTISAIAYAAAEPPTSQGHLLDLFVPETSAPLPIVIWMRAVS
jgi:hypothetical protein